MSRRRANQPRRIAAYQHILQGQIAISKVSDPASVPELEQLLQAANVLQKNFVRIATAFDAKGSPAISAEDIETFFAQQKEKHRGNASPAYDQ